MTITGPGYDLDGTIEAYSWAQISGPSLLDSKKGKNIKTDKANLDFNAPRVKKGFVRYVFDLTVTDNDGGTGSDTITLTVFK